MSEEKYTRLTYDLTVAAGEALLAANPKMTMCFISGSGTDSTGEGRQMWARVKGRAENALLAMDFGEDFAEELSEKLDAVLKQHLEEG